MDILEGAPSTCFDLARFLMGDVEAVTAVATHHYGFNKRHYDFDKRLHQPGVRLGRGGQRVHLVTALSRKRGSAWRSTAKKAGSRWRSHTLILNDSEEGPSKVWNPVFPTP